MDISNKYSSVIHARPSTPQPQAGIAVLGAGNIVNNVHLKAYAKAGYQVLGLHDLNLARAREVAALHNLPTVYPSMEALLAEPAVKIVDVAIPGAGRIPLIRQIAQAGKSMLVQKPLADTLGEAREIVAIGAQYGVKIAVNQNARWAPDYRYAICAAQAGLLGKVYLAMHLLFSNFDGMPHHARWLTDLPRFQIMQYGIHHLDMMRAWFGRTPERVTSMVSRKPNQQFKGDMLGSVLLDFGPETQGVCLEMNAMHSERPLERQWELHGTEGVIVSKAYDSLEVRDRAYAGQVFQPHFTTSWFVDGFSAVMGDLLEAVQQNREPEVSGRDNLGSIVMAEAAYRSAELGRTVALDEIWKESL